MLKDSKRANSLLSEEDGSERAQTSHVIELSKMGAILRRIISSRSRQQGPSLWLRLAGLTK